MNLSVLRAKLVAIAQARVRSGDVAHDFEHTRRVLAIAERIARAEHADLEIVIPAALFHDIIISLKHNPQSRSDPGRSAKYAQLTLSGIREYPAHKIPLVYRAINECSFSKGIKSDFLEGKIVQDADRLDVVGVLGIMRAFATTGQLKIPFYDPRDPFCRRRKPNPRHYTVDFFTFVR